MAKKRFCYECGKTIIKSCPLCKIHKNQLEDALTGVLNATMGKKRPYSRDGELLQRDVSGRTMIPVRDRAWPLHRAVEAELNEMFEEGRWAWSP